MRTADERHGKHKRTRATLHGFKPGLAYGPPLYQCALCRRWQHYGKGHQAPRKMDLGVGAKLCPTCRYVHETQPPYNARKAG